MQLIEKTIYTIIFIACPIVYTFAQPGNPGGDPDVPIDGGASLLAAAGVGYGAKKIRDYIKAKKQNQSQDENHGLN